MPMFKPIDIWGLYYLSIVVMSYKACICMVTYMGGGGREAERDIYIGIHGWEMGARRYAYTCVGCMSFA